MSESEATIWRIHGGATGYADSLFLTFLTKNCVALSWSRTELLRQNAPFNAEEQRLEFLRRLNEIPGISLPADAIDRRPTIRLATLVSPNALATFLEIVEWEIQEVKTAARAD